MAVMPKVSQAALDYIASFGIDTTLIYEGSVSPEGYELWVGTRYDSPPISEFQRWPEGFDFERLNDIYWEKPESAKAEGGAFPDAVRDETDAIARILIEKNKAYGNSALDPVRIFSDASPEEQLLVRIDDKLSRLQRGTDYADEDTVTDLIGYLILLKIARK